MYHLIDRHLPVNSGSLTVVVTVRNETLKNYVRRECIRSKQIHSAFLYRVYFSAEVVMSCWCNCKLSGFGNHDQPETMPSPIPKYQDDNHGYHSDNQDYSSDHSSVDGVPPRTRSSQSSVIGDSLHSSPAGSPFGSQTITTIPANGKYLYFSL